MKKLLSLISILFVLFACDLPSDNIGVDNITLIVIAADGTETPFKKDGVIILDQKVRIEVTGKNAKECKFYYDVENIPTWKSTELALDSSVSCTDLMIADQLIVNLIVVPYYKKQRGKSYFFNFALQTDSPKFSKKEGAISFTEKISLSTTSGATIYYTLDGSDPTEYSSRYNSSFTLEGRSNPCTVKAIAFKGGYLASDIAKSEYREKVAIPTISPNGGFFPGGSKAITLACDTVGASIYYTTDGSDPSDINGTDYNNSPFNITISSSDIVVKAIATKADFTNSQIAEATFAIPFMKTVLVEKGTFTMGSPVETPNSEVHERPMRSVTLTRDFYMGKYEVTQSQWKAVMGSDKQAYHYGSGDNFPVYFMTWYDAVDFCNALSLKEGLEPCYTGSGVSTACDFTKNGYRLPTEAEWEYAARGGKHKSPFLYSGSDTIGAVAWFYDNSGDSGTSTNRNTHAVGTKDPNALGLYDMT